MLKNWKTTLFGAAGAFLNVLEMGLSWKSALMSATIFALGAFAKDNNVTDTPSSTDTTKPN